MKIITYNMQGENWRAITWRLDQEEPDVMVIQECGNLGAMAGIQGQTDKAVCLGKHGNYNIWWLDWSRTGAGSSNPRCSMCMCFQAEGEPAVIETNDDFKRPIMVKGVSRGWTVGNIHAGGEQYIQEAIAAMVRRGNDESWVLAGDFNKEPSDIEHLVSEVKSARIVAPVEPTRPQSGRIIDYAVSNQPSTNNARPRLMKNYQGSDHVAVVIELGPPPRAAGGKAKRTIKPISRYSPY